MKLSDSQESYPEFSELWAPLHNEQLFKTDPSGMYRIERPRTGVTDESGDETDIIGKPTKPVHCPVQ
jgi:hypothetical protein